MLRTACRILEHRGATIIKVAVGAALVFAASPAIADKTFAVTPSGATEMLFPDDAETVAGKMSSKCIDVKWTVTSSSRTEVVCEAPLNAGQQFVGQLLMGNSYSTPPRRFYRFNIAEISGISRVQASGWMELQMAFGQMKRQEFTGPEFQNGVMLFMGAAGGKYPLGTTFPNHAALGVDVENVSLGKLKGFRLTKITPGSAAEKAGLQIGDVVSAIAGKRFKNNDDYLDATAKAAAKPTYEIEVMREGKTIKVVVERAFRPIWAEQMTPAPHLAATATNTSPLSVADELSKLAKLKADGIITDAEFEAQKKKLLGN